MSEPWNLPTLVTTRGGVVPWADIPGAPGYRVSAEGRVESRWGHGKAGLGDTWHSMKPQYNQRGYQVVMLIIAGQRKQNLVSRLVARAFIPNPEGLPCVRHMNGVRDDNRLENLAWGTHKQNENDKRRHGTYFTQGHQPALDAEQRAQVFELFASGLTKRAIAARFKVCDRTVARVLAGQGRGRQ